MSSFEEGPFDASKAMLTAALGGLLCFGAASCVNSESDAPSGASTGSSSDDGTGVGGAGSSTHAATTSSVSAVASTSSAGGAMTTSGTATSSSTSSGTGGAPPNPHTPIPDTECATGVIPNPVITYSTTMALTQTDFQALCDQAGGIFEVQPLCGGSNACRGFAYDSGTTTYTEHTCQGTNTCAGYNCVDCD
jgi:hypothetical protein